MSKLNCGIYKIENLIDGKMYIGGSANLYQRKHSHFSKLKYGCHENSVLQKTYVSDGKENFKFIILLYCECFELKRYEQALVNKQRKSKMLYNVHLDDVNSPSGVKKSREEILGMSARNKGKNNPFYGKTHMAKTRRKMCKNHADVSGKNNPRITSKEMVLKILKLFDKNMPVKNIAEQLDIGQTIVYRVKNGFYDDIYDL